MSLPNLKTFCEKLRALYPGAELRVDEPMSRHTSFRIGGPAAAMLLPRSVEEAAFASALAAEVGVPLRVMGNGSNLLVSDAGLDALVIKLCDGLSGVERVSDTVISAQAGVPLSRLAQQAAAWGLSGLEFAAGIPGSLGGAIFMNAGAYGGEMKSVLISVTALTPGGVKTFTKEELDLSYRHSRFTDSGEVILSAEISLTPAPVDDIRGKMDELAARRRASQPLNMPSAGSAFKRPATGYAAALIDGAGLKGLTVGGAQVSEKHAGFIVNIGGATCSDVLELMDQVRSRVLAASGVELEPEIKVLR